MNFAEVLEQAAERWPKRTALVMGETELSYADLIERAAAIAAGLKAQRLRPGDRFAFIAPNCIEFAEVFFGSAAVPAVLVPIDGNLKANEIADILADVKPVLISAAPSAQGLLDEVVALPNCATRAIGYEDLAESAGLGDFKVPVIDADATALILYTSGTVGGSKGVMLSYGNMDYSPQAMLEGFKGLADDYVAGLAVPISHIAGPMLCLTAAMCGGSLVILERFVPHRFLAECERTGVTFTALVPPMIQALLQVKEWEKFPLKKMRFGCSFGAMASMEVLNNFASRYPHFDVTTGYGLTETAPLVALVPSGTPIEKFGTLGKRLPFAEIRILDDAGKDLPADETGEIVVRGPMLMQGYWGKPEATAEVIRDGWFHTGDVGKFDADDYLWIQGRMKDIINVAGLKVFAPEIEDVLYGHPAIEEVAVIAAAGGIKGETVKAVVKLKDGVTVSEQDLMAYCREQMADFKVPRQIEFRDQPLPRSRTGKLNKEALKES